VIFVTVGAQMPFERLIKTVDTWAKNKTESVFAQIGLSKYKPLNIEWVNFLSTDDLRFRMKNARFIISHAGMGTIMTAIEIEKYILVMPRRIKYQETRTDHQFEALPWIKKLSYVQVAADENELLEKLYNIHKLKWVKRVHSEDSYRSLINTIKVFIEKNE
jgi:UDP-N-acetylglucosamine transferase subunit ALG13